MVNTELRQPTALRTLQALVIAYVVIVVATIVLLVVLSAAAPDQATSEAWGHAIVVTVFAVLLAVRTRAALAGRPGAIAAVRVIAVVLLVANLVEAALPGVFPGWMRVEMLVIAVLMLATALSAHRSDTAR